MGVNKIKFEKDLEETLNDAAFNAFLSTFNGLVNDDSTFEKVKSISEEFAKQFASKAAPEIVDQVTTYIEGCTVDLSKCLTPQSLTSTAGPATGLLMGKIIGGVKCDLV